MTVFLPRSAWTNHGPRVSLTPLSAGPLRGFAIHWPGDSQGHIDATNQGHIAGILEGERKYHTSPGGLGTKNGGSDIAYQYAIDLKGRVWELRGARFQSGANGNSAVNQAYGAVTLILGTNDVPSPEMVQAVKDFRRKVWLARWPKATRVVGHRDLYSTDCPGSHAYPLVKNGTFTRSTPPSPPPKPPKPPTPPKHVRTPLMTNYVYGEGQDAYVASALAAGPYGVLQVFRASQAKQAAAQGNAVLILGGPAVKTLAIAAPAGATTRVGNYVVANGHDGAETITRGLAAVQALPAG